MYFKKLYQGWIDEVLKEHQSIALIVVAATKHEQLSVAKLGRCKKPTKKTRS
jgi:hypothetical protein